MSDVGRFCGWNDIYGNPMETSEYIDQIREEDKENRKKNFICDQEGGQERILASNADISITGGARGGPLVVGTRVVTPFGYRRIGDMKVGDILCGVDGHFQKVITKVDHGMLHCYKLKFVDGSEVVASYDHPWNIRRTCRISKTRRASRNIPLEKDWEVWTTQMIVDRIAKKKSGEIKNGHIVIPLCEPVRFTHGNSRHGVNPYLLGVILGDGCISNNIVKHNNILITTTDEEIVEAFKADGFDIHRRSEKGKEADYIFKSESFVAALKTFGLAGHLADSKFIPPVFKLGTVDERLSILQGLMDTDGTIDKRGHCSFTTISEQLAKDVKYLVNSLGGIATINKHETSYKKDGIEIKCAYSVYIRIKDSYRIFRLKRKKELSSKYNGGISEYTRRIIDFEDAGMQPCCCIGVSNPDSLFLVEDFIVTHNSKSFSILLDGVKDVMHPNFSAVILRHEKPDLENIINDSKNVYRDFGTYISSEKDMRWDLKNGGKIKFSYHAGDYDDFVIRFQGKQYAYIAVDEVTHISLKKFLYLLTCLRNSHGIRNRVVGSCNPDKRSWVRQFIDWWIGNENTIYADGKRHPELKGFPIPERNGKIRYCFMAGCDNISDIVWGDSRDEVYEKVKDKIALLWDDSMNKFGDPRDIFIMSVSFVEAKVTDNVKLLESDPAYIARLANQSYDRVMADLRGNWDADLVSDDYVTEEEMTNFLGRTRQYGDSVRRASLDVAFEGGDAAWMWLRVGNHYADFVSFHLDSCSLIDAVREQLEIWGVKEENFTYDLNGIGQAFRGFFKKAVPFNNLEAPWASTEEEQKKIKFEFDNLKSQTFFSFADDLIAGNISIEPELLKRRIVSKGIDNIALKDVLMSQRRIIKLDVAKLDSSKGKCLIAKKEMKRMLGYSPDAMESMAYAHVFFVKATKRKTSYKPTGACRYTPGDGRRTTGQVTTVRASSARMNRTISRTRYI